jgi:hypothetical protein
VIVPGTNIQGIFYLFNHFVICKERTISRLSNDLRSGLWLKQVGKTIFEGGKDHPRVSKDTRYKGALFP